MNRHNSFPSFNIAFGGLARPSCQNDTTEPQLYYQGMSVQTAPPPCSAYFRQSNADLNSAHPIDPLSEFRVASLTQAVPDGFDELDFTQASNDNPANSAEIVDDKSSQVKRQKERQRELHREYHKNPAFIERERQRKSELHREYRKNPAFVERERQRKSELHREYLKNPAFLERERVRSRIYCKMRKKFGKEEASKLASVTSKRHLQSVNSSEESGASLQNSNKNLDVTPSQAD